MNLRDVPIKKKLTMAIMLTSTVALFLTAAVFIIHEAIPSRRWYWDAGMLALIWIGCLGVALVVSNALQRALHAGLEERVSRRTAELAAANQELEAFTYSVSHDLRAPLRHIDSFARILEDEILKDPDGARQYVSRIRRIAQNMDLLVDDLLGLSRLGHVSLERRTIRLNAVVDAVLAELPSEVKNRRIDWRIAPLPSAGVDPGLIKQVFANLISNAVKFTRTRAQAVIEIGVEPAGGATAVFIRDNGAGFDMKEADKLFGAFQRLHQVEDFEGNGIGLAVVQRIVQLHGGKIWCHAELDKGATFHFTLPVIEAAGPVQESAAGMMER